MLFEVMDMVVAAVRLGREYQQKFSNHSDANPIKLAKLSIALLLKFIMINEWGDTEYVWEDQKIKLNSFDNWQ